MLTLYHSSVHSQSTSPFFLALLFLSAFFSTPCYLLKFALSATKNSLSVNNTWFCFHCIYKQFLVSFFFYFSTTKDSFLFFFYFCFPLKKIFSFSSFNKKYFRLKNKRKILDEGNIPICVGEQVFVNCSKIS